MYSILGRHIQTQVIKTIKLPYKIPKLGLTMDILKPWQFHDAAKLTSYIFNLEEPLVSYLKIPQHDTYQHAMETLNNRSNESISVVITTQQSEIVASLICAQVVIGAFKSGIDPCNFTPSSYKIMKLIKRQGCSMTITIIATNLQEE